MSASLQSVAATPKRAVLVTGGASGIGRAIAARLEGDGTRVLAADIRPDPAGPGFPFAADLSTSEGNRAAVEATLEQFGRLDAVVASAGLQHVAPVAEFPEERWDALQAVLLRSPFLLAKYAWEPLCAAADGRFLAIASAHGLVASPHKAAYVAAKHGLLGLVKVLAIEGAQYGICATAICPGYVRTPLVEDQIEAHAAATGIEPRDIIGQVLLAPQAVKRMLEPDEVAAVAGFILGPDGRAFTGASLAMDNGWTAR